MASTDDDADGDGAPPIDARSGSLWVNPHLVEDGYNGIEGDPQHPGASLRHFFGTDVRRAITESGHFNGRARELAVVHTILAAAVEGFGVVREVYLRDRDREVTVSFGDRAENRLWISGGSVRSRGQVHTLQYLDRPDMDLWRVDLSDAGPRTGPRPSPKPAGTICSKCFVRLPLARVRACPTCGDPIAESD